MAVRETWVYPADGGEPYLKGSRPDYVARSALAGAMFAPDHPEFHSPVDGKVYSGRAGLREHNARNNVVLTADLAGLPTLQTNSDMRSAAEKRAYAENRKSHIIREVQKHVTP